MRRNAVLIKAVTVVLVLALMASAAPVGAGNGLRSGYSTVRHWNSTITGAAPTPTPPPAQAGSCDWTGDWKTNWAGMHLSQTGGQVSGTYGLMGERITGTVSGNTLIGTWSESPTYSPPTDAGDVEFTISADCNSFTGQWRYGSSGDWDGIWTGTRIGAAPTVDSDGDGVPDGNDQCAGTPAGTPVDSTGCPLAQDSDGDGVPDSQDQCANTPAGAVVDANGCALVDSDKDGVPDVDDLCLGTPPGTVVDADGCATLNNPPICSFTIVPQNPTPSDMVVGTSTSVDLDGDTLTYSWYFDGEYDSSLGNSAGWQYTLDDPGIWTIKLVVDDGRGGTHSHTKKVAVSEGPLLCQIYSVTGELERKCPCSDFDHIRCNGRFEGGVPPYLYEWHFGDGDETGWLDAEDWGPVQAYHQYDCPGRYRVLLVVQDATGAEAYDEQTVEILSTFAKRLSRDSRQVLETETVYPTIGFEPVPGKSPDDFGHYYVKFTCYGVKGGFPPYDYYWDFGDGGITGTAFINNVAWVVHDYWSLGEYTVKVKVFDSCNSEVESSILYEVGAEEEEVKVLVVTSVDKLQSKFGASGWAQIEDRLKQLEWTILDIGSASVDAIDLAIEEKAADHVPDISILILGGDDVVPFPMLSAGRGWWPRPTDDVYADFDHDPWTVIDVPIARIPDGGDLGLVLTRLFGSYSPSSGGFALVSAGGRRYDYSKEIARTLGADDISPLALSVKYVFFNLHGDDDDTTTWWGEPVGSGISPQAFQVHLASSRGIIYAPGCYSAYVIDKYPGNSICLQFLKNGARCFIGSTMRTWIAERTGMSGALFDRLMVRQLIAQQDPLQAFFEAKREFASHLQSEGDRTWRSRHISMMHSLIYYGRP